jgi:hypothetical protein
MHGLKAEGAHQNLFLELADQQDVDKYWIR